MPQGRAITSEQTERLLEGLRHGMTRRAAAAYAGFHWRSLYRMMERSGTLVTEIEKAEHEAVAAYVQIIANAAVKNWTAAAWMLERRHPDDFGKRDRVEVTFDFRKAAEAAGLDPDAVMAEADAILSGQR